MEVGDLTKKEKKTFAKVAFDLNIPAAKIAEALEINRTTVYRYSDSPTDGEMGQFATEIGKFISTSRYVTIAKILKNIEKLTGESCSIKDLSYAFDVLNKRAIFGSSEESSDDNEVTFTITRRP